jgi:hypothetical protein
MQQSSLRIENRIEAEIHNYSDLVKRQAMQTAESISFGHNGQNPLVVIIIPSPS